MEKLIIKMAKWKYKLGNYLNKKAQITEHNTIIIINLSSMSFNV